VQRNAFFAENIASMTHFQLIVLVLCLFSCGKTKTIEHTDGNMTDRYTVDQEGLRHGEFHRFFGGDTLSEKSTYVHGLLQGERIIYHVSGKPEIVEQYRNDTLQGKYTVYFEDGSVKIEGTYVDGEMRGIWKRYYPGGQVLEEVTYEGNEENGPFKEYHESGKLKAVGQYLGGDFEQDSLFLYDESGVLEKKMLCNHGICQTVWISTDTTNQ
jgi:antitoxin component YwqK of YwqJK toxin-antitoxin module